MAPRLKRNCKNKLQPGQNKDLIFLVSVGTFREIAKSHNLHRHVCPSARQSAWNNLAPTGRIFMKVYISVFF